MKLRFDLLLPREQIVGIAGLMGRPPTSVVRPARDCIPPGTKGTIASDQVKVDTHESPDLPARATTLNRSKEGNFRASPLSPFSPDLCERENIEDELLDCDEFVVERAAIMEFDGKLSRKEAAMKARLPSNNRRYRKSALQSDKSDESA